MDGKLRAIPHIVFSGGVTMSKAIHVDALLSTIVGRQARKYRHVAGKSQDEIAEACGIYRTYLSRIEAGTANPTVNVLSALAATLGVRISDLFEESNEIK
jgi:DNA-binding XRE family transcriptional regulator